MNLRVKKWRDKKSEILCDSLSVDCLLSTKNFGSRITKIFLGILLCMPQLLNIFPKVNKLLV